MDRASGTIDLANGRYGEVRMASPVPFTQKRTVVIRAKVMESKRIYRDIEISSDSTLEDLALATVEAFGSPSIPLFFTSVYLGGSSTWGIPVLFPPSFPKNCWYFR